MNPPVYALASVLSLVLSLPLSADLFVSNFTQLNGTAGASGVWRNHTTATDLPIPVQLSQTGGLVRALGTSSSGSRVDDSFPWQAVPGGANAFNPNFDGDFINIQTATGATATVTLTFNAQVTNPVLSLTNVEYRTTLTFPSAFTVLRSTSNLSTTSTTLTSDRSFAANDSFSLFGDQAACSIQFTGTFTQLVFTVAVGPGDGTAGSTDRTGYVVTSATAPVAVSAASPTLSISRTGGQVTLSWQLGAFSQIQMSSPGSLSGWTAIPGLNPASSSSWTDEIADLGGARFFRGVFGP